MEALLVFFMIVIGWIVWSEFGSGNNKNNGDGNTSVTGA